MDDKDGIPQVIFDKLAAADWETIGKKMLARAIWRGKTRYIGISATTIFARGFTLEDVISEIILSVFSGKRKWNPNKINLEDWLSSQIDSVMDWILNLVENKMTIPLEDSPNSNSTEQLDFSQIQAIEFEAAIKYGHPNPENEVIDRLNEKEKNDCYNTLYDELSDDPELQEVLIAIMDLEDAKPRNLAKLIGISVDDVNNRKKRLQRRIRDYFINHEREL